MTKLTSKQKEENRRKAIKEIKNMIKNPKPIYVWTSLKGFLPVFLIMSALLLIQSHGRYCFEQQIPGTTQYEITNILINGTPLLEQTPIQLENESKSYHYYYKKYEKPDGSHILPSNIYLNCTYNLKRLWKETKTWMMNPLSTK